MRSARVQMPGGAGGDHTAGTLIHFFSLLIHTQGHVPEEGPASAGTSSLVSTLIPKSTPAIFLVWHLLLSITQHRARRQQPV